MMLVTYFRGPFWKAIYQNNTKDSTYLINKQNFHLFTHKNKQCESYRLNCIINYTRDFLIIQIIQRMNLYSSQLSFWLPVVTMKKYYDGSAQKLIKDWTKNKAQRTFKRLLCFVWQLVESEICFLFSVAFNGFHVYFSSTVSIDLLHHSKLNIL